MLEYLAVIEKKTNDILQLYYLLQNKVLNSKEFSDNCLERPIHYR